MKQGKREGNNSINQNENQQCVLFVSGNTGYAMDQWKGQCGTAIMRAPQPTAETETRSACCLFAPKLDMISIHRGARTAARSPATPDEQHKKNENQQRVQFICDETRYDIDSWRARVCTMTGGARPTTETETNSTCNYFSKKIDMPSTHRGVRSGLR